MNATPAAQVADVILTAAEVRDLSGGYSQPAAQLRALHKLGYWRAHRSTVTGAVIVERAHYLAVAAGASAHHAAPSLRPAPTLRHA